MGNRLGAVALGLLAAFSVPAQMEITPSPWNGKVLLYPTDAAVLEMPERRKDLPCEVTPIEPALGFDRRFHAGYRIRIPLRELAGGEGQLRTLVRVSPVEGRDSQFYLADRFQVPFIAEDAEGEAVLQGNFTAGEGRYRVDWLMRDRTERVCSTHWEFTAKKPERDRHLDLVLPAHTVAPEPKDLFEEQPPVERDEPPLHVKILLHFSPQRAGAVTVDPDEANALLSILRGIAREPRIGRFCLVAFNLQQQRILFRQDNTPRIDFPNLGSSLESLNLAVVDYRKLQEKNGDGLFLAALLEETLGRPDDSHDAVIFVGPKPMPGQGELPETWKQKLPEEHPVFYMNYSRDPRVNPWRDAITTVVKNLRGRVYTISRPGELATAWHDIMTRVTGKD